MNSEKMTYYYSDLKKCADQIKSINQTVRHKAEHFQSACNIKKIQEFCYDTTHDYNFSYDYSIVQDYFKAAYDAKSHTKNELDTMLKRCYRYLANEINSIVASGNAGEVNLIYDLQTA
jgi:hypothetical protein